MSSTPEFAVKEAVVIGDKIGVISEVVSRQPCVWLYRVERTAFIPDLYHSASVIRPLRPPVELKYKVGDPVILKAALCGIPANIHGVVNSIDADRDKPYNAVFGAYGGIRCGQDELLPWVSPVSTAPIPLIKGQYVKAKPYNKLDGRVAAGTPGIVADVHHDGPSYSVFFPHQAAIGRDGFRWATTDDVVAVGQPLPEPTPHVYEFGVGDPVQALTNKSNVPFGASGIVVKCDESHKLPYLVFFPELCGAVPESDESDRLIGFYWVDEDEIEWNDRHCDGCDGYDD
jgi:hypothetical protein